MGGVHGHFTVHMWRPANDLEKSVLSFRLASFRDQTPVMRLGGKCPCPLNHPTSSL